MNTLAINSLVMDDRAVSVEKVTDDNAMRLNAKIALDDVKQPVSLEKQDLQSSTQSMRLTQCVTHGWKNGTCEHCKNDFQKKVTWQKFCCEDCRIANWELTHGTKIKKGKK